MGWFAIADTETTNFRPPRTVRKGHLPCGTLMIETRLSPDGGPQTLFAFESHDCEVFKLSVQAIPGGGVVLVMAENGEAFHAALNHDAQDRADLLRISYSWDLPRGRGRLAIERPEHGKMVKLMLENPRAMRVEDVQAMTCDPRRRLMDRDVEFFAISEKVEPIGPAPSLGADVPILTSDRYVCAQDLQRGDLVETLEAGLVPVLHAVRRTVPARGSFRPVRLRAPYFGLRSDIVVAPDQRLVVGGSEVEYIFGREAVLVPARHLVNGISAISLNGSPTVTYCQVILPRHESMIGAGCPIESLYIGRLRRKPAQLAQSVLAKIDRTLLPEHPKSSYPMLRPFEAITLMQRRAA
ncbi:Hint domain-containing protein [Aquicoccus porphyridii]|uniref:Hint domain-containing protein n=1 Tax=Aquicoccus porphyridii TaxID=1852029 RepID=UPI00273F3C8F|nr:Hint domain-containing protein [Aquicoccus porphyridii]